MTHYFISDYFPGLENWEVLGLVRPIRRKMDIDKIINKRNRLSFIHMLLWY